MHLSAITASAPSGTATADGAVLVGVDGGGGIRVPWAIAFGRDDVDLIASATLSGEVVQPRPTRSPRCSRSTRAACSSVDGQPEIRPARAARRRALARRRHRRSGSLARLRDVLPGRYTFGLTGRGPDGQLLPPGDYVLRIVAYPVERGPAEPPHACRSRSSDELDVALGDGGRSTGLAPPREPVRDRARAAAARRGDLRHRPEPRQRPRRVQEGGRGLRAGRHGRRHDERLQGLPRHAQRRARPVEGRHPLPPGRHARRGQGARDVDDVEVRADGHPVRRREGRRRRRPEAAVARRARADDAPLHERDHQRDRPGEGHPRARRRHRRLGDGVDLRHVLDEQGPLGARRRHRQAADDRRLARPRRGDRARRALLHPRRRREAGRPARRHDRRRAGLRQRRLATSRSSCTRRARRVVAISDSTAALHNAKGIDVAAAFAHKREHGTLAGLAGRRGDHERRAARARRRHPRAVRARAGDHRAERRPGARRRSSAKARTGR